MGGSSYDRDVYSSSSSSGWGSSYDYSSSERSGFGVSSESERKISSTFLDDSMKPNGKIMKSRAKHPIIVVLDVTGSNIDFARVVYDKMPMFYGQIEQQRYLDDFEIAFCAVGDAKHDSYPLQIPNFAKGIEIDSWLEKLVLEGGGGSFGEESYELAAYYLLQNTEFEKGAKPIIFFIGDERPYAEVSMAEAARFGIEVKQPVEPFGELRKKVKDNVFMLLNKACGRYFEDGITACWERLLAPQHVIKVEEEKSIVDLMLGVISMHSGARTLSTYKVDMLDRGQTHERIASVSKSLDSLSKALVPVKVTGDIVKASPSSKKSNERGKRI